MQASWINLFIAGWLLPCLVCPLQNDPRQSYVGHRDVYDPANHRSQPTYPEIYRGQYHGPNIPSPLTNEYNYPPIYFQNPWIPVNYANPVKDQESETDHLPRRESYDNSRQFARDNRKQESLNIERGKFQQQKRQDGETSFEDEAEIIEKMNILDKFLSDDSSEKDLETNMIEDKIIPEETKRVVRQVRKQRPGFFWTLARITFESINDTRSAIKQISEIINNNVAPDSATQSTVTSAALTAAGKSADQANTSNNLPKANASETTTMGPTTTTEENYVLTRNGLQTLIRRNILGLVRLFNIEWRDALNESETSVRQFQKELGNQVGTYLQDNPDAY